MPNRRRIANLASQIARPILPAILLLPLLLAVPPASAQSATAVPQLDPNRLLGTYFTIARYPIKRQKHCLADEMVLYDLGDKKNTIQIVTTCDMKGTEVDSWNANGKFSKTGNGQIKLAWIWPFTTKYWVLALAPDYSWALVGTPNHKSLWILSRAITLAPETLTAIESQASAQGFNTSKLIHITQNPRPTAPPPTASQPSSKPAIANPPAKPPTP